MQLTSSKAFSPKDHQRLIHRHLMACSQALVLAGMGLGKTASCLWAVRDLFLDCAIKGVLVVAPLRVINLVWPAEVELWKPFNWLKVAHLRTPEGQEAFRQGSAHIYLINYESLPKILRLLLHRKRLKDWPIDMVIWDEVTRAKSHKSKRIRAAKHYLWKIERHWGLTGTPAPNGLLDLFGQAHLIDKGQALGDSFTAFRNRYFQTDDYQGRKWVPQDHARASIYKRLEPLAISLTSREWIGIPDAIEEDIEIALPPEAKAQYATLKKKLLLLLASGNEIVAVNAAVLVNKLLQVTSGALYLEGSKEWEAIHNAKILAAAKFVKANGSPVLVACNFKHEQERLAKAIPGSVRFSDAKTFEQMTTMAKLWNARKIPALIANPQSIGHGLNLQFGGQTILWTTLTWSRDYYDQTNARLVRPGQEELVKVVRLMIPGTVDDAVAVALRHKEEEQSALMAALSAFKRLV